MASLPRTYRSLFSSLVNRGHGRSLLSVRMPITAHSQRRYFSYDEKLPHSPPPGFRVRDAELSDVKSIVDVWYNSFYPSHKFWEYITPDTPATRKWLDGLWSAGIKAGPKVTRTFVVEDIQQDKIVAFSRWHVPQDDRNQYSPRPDTFPDELDPKVFDGLWGEMGRSRLRVMGDRLHWVGEFIGIAQSHHGKGISYPLMDWGMRQADATGLELYGDATIRGLPVWKYYGWKEVGLIEVPAREAYGTYRMVPIVRPPQSARPARYLKSEQA